MIEYTAKNGYKGVIYGEKSLKIVKDGKIVFHTASRNINSFSELKDMVDTFPEFLQELRAHD